MRNFLAVFFFLLSAFTLEAQIGLRPSFFTEETNPTNSNFEVYSQKNGLTRRASLDNIKKWVAPFFNPDTIAYIPTSWGNTTDLASFVYDSTGLLWYIDGQGDAVSFTTALGTDRNGFFDVANEGDTIAINTVVFDNLTLTQLNGDAQLQLGADIFDAIVESQAVIAGDRSILHLDTLGRAVIGVQLGTPESYVGFDNAVGDSIGLYVQINSALPTPGQTLVAGPDSLFRFANLSSGLSDLNDLGDVDTSGLSIDNLLRWNGTDWVPVTTTQIIWEQALVYGQGLAGRTTYWDTDTTLNYTAITYSANEWNAIALTGAVGVPSGTVAQRPTGAAGKIRFNSDLGDLEFYNGSAWRSLPESSANAFTAGQFIIANPAGILTDTTTAGALSMLGGVSGTGTANQVAYWSGTSALTGHANLLWDGTELSVGTTSSAYTLEVGTGGMRLAPQSAAPTGASGLVYYDSDDNWFLGYNGTTFHYFPRGDAAAWATDQIPYSNGANLTSTSAFTYTPSGAILRTGSVKTGDAANIYTIDIRMPAAATGGNVSIGTTYDHGGASAVAKSVAIGYGAGISASGTSSTAIGAATTAGDRATAVGADNTAVSFSTVVGRNSSTSFTGNLAIGNNAVASGNIKSIAIGGDVTASGNRAIAIGGDANVSGSSAVGIGKEVVVAHDGSIVIGYARASTAAGQFIASNVASGISGITDVFFGSGVNRYSGSDAAGLDYAINGSGARGTDFAGGHITIAGGKGTGSGAPGVIIFSTSTAGASSSSLQSLTERARFNAAGRLGIGTTSPDSELEVVGKVKITSLPDSLYRYEVRADINGRFSRQEGAVVGAISTTTDGSGDVTVTHSMGTTPTAVLVTPTGTTPWIVSVHTIGATTFKVRFYDAAGAAVTTTAVTATWLGKT